MQKPKDVDDYITSTSLEAQPILLELRTLVKEAVQKAQEKIGYGVPFYTYHGELCGFDAFTRHVTFGFGADYTDDKVRAALEAKCYKVLKETLHIRFDQTVPANIIKKLLQQKAKQNEARTV